MKQFEAILTAAGLSSVTSSFSSLDSDLSRVEHFLKYPCVQEFRPLACEMKCDSRAATFRSKGNKCLEQRDFKTALLNYTRAVFVADSRLERALGHGNRSMVLCELEFFDDCLLEVERAIESGFPTDRLFRLHARAGECLLYQGHFTEARERLLAALSFLSANNSEAWRSRIQKSLELCTRRKLSKEKRGRSLRCQRPQVEPIGKEDWNRNLPAASSALELVETEDAGRGVVTTRDVQIGEVLLVERPYCSRLVADCFETHCYNCHIRCLTLLPCRSCDKIGFCSQGCQLSAWTPLQAPSPTFPPSGHCSLGHPWECPVMSLYITNPVSSLAPLAYASVARTPLAEVCRRVAEGGGEHPYPPSGPVSSDSGPLKQPSYYASWDYVSALSIVGNSGARTGEDLLARTSLAVFMMACLKTAGYFSQTIDDVITYTAHSQEALVAAALLRHLQSLPCNAHDVAEQVISAVPGSCPERKDLSAALYPTLSLINHSCSPNVVRFSFAGDTCQLRAIAPLPKGTQLMDNYSVHYALLTREERQRTLVGQYFFRCACLPCAEDWPTFAGMMQEQKPPKYHCPSCLAPLTSNLPPATCPSCTAQLSRLWSQLAHYRAIFPERMGQVVEGGQCPPQVAEDAVGYLRCLHQLVDQPYYEFDQALETLKMVWNLEANTLHDFE